MEPLLLLLLLHGAPIVLAPRLPCPIGMATWSSLLLEQLLLQ